MKETALVIQGMAGFDTFLAGVFEKFQEKGVFPAAIATEGASIAPAIWFSAQKPMKDYLEKMKDLHFYSTPPFSVLTGTYTNGYFHSSNSMDFMINLGKGKLTSFFSYHYHPDMEKDREIRESMKAPVYSGIINLLSGEHRIVNLQEFSRGKYYRWLGGRIPYFTPTTIENETYVEDYYRNPPLKPIMDNPKIKNLIFIRSFPVQDRIPDNYLELQDRDIQFTMNSYFDREIDFIEKINQFVKKGLLPESDYRVIEKLSCHIHPEPMEYLDYTPSGLEKKYEWGLAKGRELVKELEKMG
jgi:hypothetical protein